VLHYRYIYDLLVTQFNTIRTYTLLVGSVVPVDVEVEVEVRPVPPLQESPPALPHSSAPVARVTPPAAPLTAAMVRRVSAAVSRSPGPHARQEGGGFVQRQP